MDRWGASRSLLYRSRRLGRRGQVVLRGAFATISALAGVGGVLAPFLALLFPPGERLGMVLLGLVLMALTLPSFARARRLGTPFVRGLLRSPVSMPRPDEDFVLWLRPFAVDDRNDYAGGYTFFTEFTATLRALQRPSMEEVISEALANVGPLLSIGSPEDIFPGTARRRLYVSEESWKERVVDLISRARLVVLAVGLSEHVIWELGRVTELRSPEDVLLIVPFGDGPQPTGAPQTRGPVWQEFRGKAESVLPVQLPSGEDLGRACVLGFGPGWKPYPILGTSTKWQRFMGLGPLGRDLKEASGGRGLP